METILAILPFLIMFVPILFFKWQPLRAIALALSALLFLVIFIWQMPSNWIFASSLKGIFLSLEIILIVFGAIFFISVLKISNLEKKIKSLVENISQDRRVQLVIIAWAFTALIEGSAGFGAPAILASAILIALNFPIVQAVIFSLVGSAIHTSFGAVGTPIVFGFGASLAQSDVLIFLQNQNLSFTEFLGGIAVNIAFFNLFIGVAICFIMMFLLIFIFNKEGKNKIKHFLEIIPFIIITSLLVTIPAYLISVFFGPELPSLIGGLIGLFLILIIAQKSWFLPKKRWDFNQVVLIEKKEKTISFFNIFKILLPYLFFVIIIFLSRADFLFIENWILSLPTISFNQIFDTNINYSFNPFYSLGMILFFYSLCLALFFKQSFNKIKTTLFEVFHKTKKVALILILILIFVKIIVYSGENLSNIQSIPILLANSIINFSGPFWPFIIPIIGAFGSFISGGTTFSNLLFADLHINIAMISNLDLKMFLALQSVGASLGNMISIHNIIIVLAVVGQMAKIGLIMKFNMIIVFLLCFLLGLITFFFVA